MDDLYILSPPNDVPHSGQCEMHSNLSAKSDCENAILIEQSKMHSVYNSRSQRIYTMSVVFPWYL